MQLLCRLVAWSLAIVIVILHVVPPTHRPVTAASHNVEHLAIFLALGLAFGLGFARRARPLVVALPLYCLIIEAMQYWVPGRHARVLDLLVNVTSVLVGLGLAVVITRTVIPRRWLS